MLMRKYRVRKGGVEVCTWREDRNQMFWPIFARGLWPETFKASFSRTNQTANKRRRQKKRVKIFLNLTYLHKTLPGQKTNGNFPNCFEDIYSPDVWVSRFGCRFKYLTIFFFIHQAKNLQYILPNNTTYKILYPTTKTIPFGAKIYVYQMAT